MSKWQNLKAQSVEKVDSAAPEDKVRRCGRCFTAVTAGARFCPDCGASLDTGDPNASDAAVEQELANANLSRIRKEYKSAEEQCLAILRRFPNSVSANVLMGDICYERGEFQHSAEWYELALDLDPRSVPTQQKLVDARRLADPDMLPPGLEAAFAGPRTRLPVWAWGSILAFVILLAAAALWPKLPASKPGPSGVVRTNVVAPLREQPPTPDEASRVEPPPSVAIDEDRRFLERLAALPEIGPTLIYAQYDPRTKTARLAFQMPKENPKALAAQIGKAILQADQEVTIVAMRGIEGGRSAFFADFLREKLPADGVEVIPDAVLTDVYPPEVRPSDAP